jgi:hypothetical protein
MDERVGFALFFAIFILIYYFLNYFVVSQYFKLFSIPKNFWFYILVISMTLSYIVAAGLEAYSNNIFFKVIYAGASVWMGMLFLSFCVLMIYLLINKFTPITNWMTGIVVLMAVVVLTVYGILNAYNIHPTNINVYNDKGINLKVVQISDLHLGPINGEKYLKKVVRKVNHLNPDVVLITGDLLDGRYYYNESIFKPLDDINATTYTISGNHDYYAGIDRFERFLKNTKVKWLRNGVVKYEGIYILGLDDSSDRKNVEVMLRAINDDIDLSAKFTILMNHRPIGWESASTYVDMMISGHTHAGQIWPFSYLAWLDSHVIKGVYRMPENNHFMLYVSPGTGTWGPPMRIGSRTEITVYNIKSSI